MYSKSRECCGCTACVNICPNHCIEMKEDNEGFLYPKLINKKKCIDCGACERVCPIKNKIKESTSKAFAAYCKDEVIRKESSSGGIFTIISQKILRLGGTVYGAAFDENFKVNHIKINRKEELYKLRTSKYVQSNLDLCFREVIQDINNGKIVLFSGTPCQVAGLKTLLGVNNKNLITIDLACHGVPSPKIFELYKRNLEELYDSKITKLNFRDKEEGWTNYKLNIQFDNGKRFTDYGYENLYMKGFIKNLFIRPSCSDCKFKNLKSYSDLTLADYWGVENIEINLSDNQGISLVFAHSKIGERIVSEIKDDVYVKETNIESALEYNPSIIRSEIRNKNSKKFFENVDSRNILELIKKYTEEKKESKIHYYYRAIKNKINQDV